MAFKKKLSLNYSFKKKSFFLNILSIGKATKELFDRKFGVRFSIFSGTFPPFLWSSLCNVSTRCLFVNSQKSIQISFGSYFVKLSRDSQWLKTAFSLSSSASTTFNSISRCSKKHLCRKNYLIRSIHPSFPRLLKYLICLNMSMKPTKTKPKFLEHENR